VDFKTLLNNGFVLLDGAIGTMLQEKGLKAGELPELLNISHPNVIEEIQREYVEAGANIVYTNTFGANRYKMKDSGHTVDELISSAVAISKSACKGTKSLVALDIGPIGEMLEPTGSLSFEMAYDIFSEQVIAGVKAGVDLVVVETMTDLYEMRAALLAVKENSNLPIICTMTFEENGRTFSGVSVAAMAVTLEGLGADVIGINCSLGPNEIIPIAKELIENTNLPVVVKPNAGLPNLNTNIYDVDADDFTKSILELVRLGVCIVGGCCGTTPEYIKKMAIALKSEKPIKRERITRSAICSYANVVVIDGVNIIGERINPTGKKLLKEALKNGNTDYILSQAFQQIKAGASILDVNVGLPEIDEKAVMVRVVKALQGVVDTPLQIDSSSKDVIEAGLRVYNGKAIVNSVNGEEEVLDSILPLVKKYGAAVVGLTLDKNGIPPKAQERVAIAEKILNKALSYGIEKSDVYIDCLTLTASAEQAAVVETLKAVKMVKENLGLKTVLGVSNISFGLPNRELINQSFLTLAMAHGLDLPILNPNISAMTDAINTFNLLYNNDKDAKNFVSVYGGMNNLNTQKVIAPTTSDNLDVAYAIENGLKDEARRITTELLKTVDPLVLVNDMLIPALDKVGVGFGNGEVFLPQLIQSAGAVEVAFEIIKAKFSSSSVSKGKIVLATVKGDIHDIGKNIVKVLLENYGYTVIDLGRDVEHSAVINAVIEHKADLVGLSALMTTTIKSMEQTISLLKENNLTCKIMVGGAVLTEDYALKMGADFYAKDAKTAVDIARKVYGA